MIQDINFRHYGGMPSALEARELTEKSKITHKLKRIEEIAADIRHAAEELGYNNTNILLLDEEVGILKSLGYIITYIADSSSGLKYPREGLTQQYKVYSVSWNATHLPSNPPEDML